ncbi:MAG: 3-phosphoshikimate 1-carboxyvinyltransferase [Campylobacteraceae bacterium]
MSSLHVKRAPFFNLEIEDIASDKSISHRCAIFSLLSNRMSAIKNYLEAEDTLCTLKIVESLGARVVKNNSVIFIMPPFKLEEPTGVLDCGNSGTAIRMLMGFLASREGTFVLEGDKYLNSRPMGRVTNPLRNIGAKIDGKNGGEYAPITIQGSKLKAFNYESKISSAQVKSALILAALNADGVSTYVEPELSRNHTELMLRGMGASILHVKDKLVINPQTRALDPLTITVPADPSSAFFFAVAAAIIPKSKVVLKNVLLNKTRVEAYKILAKMGAIVDFLEKENKYESIGDITVEHNELNAVDVDVKIPWLIDELPALSIAFASAKGVSRVRNAKELRVKECDRISAVVNNLKLCGINASEVPDGYDIEGGELKSANITSFGDHRIAMSFAIAGLLCDININDTDCINTSFPNFIEILQRITQVD